MTWPMVPDANPNSVELMARLDALPPAWRKLVHEYGANIVIALIDEGETKSLPELVFRLPKSLAAGVNHVGLGVSDGKLLWPIAAELK